MGNIEIPSIPKMWEYDEVFGKYEREK